MKQAPLKWFSFVLCILLSGTSYQLLPLSKKYRDLITHLKQGVQRRMLSPFIQTFFPPQDKLRPLLCALIEEETDQIDIEAFQLTDQTIAKSLLDAYKNRNVKVTIIADISALGRYSKVIQLYNAGVPVYIYPPEEAPSQQYALMHNKIMLFHSLSCVVTGSMNFTKSGLESNQENVLIIQHKELFKDYYRQFMWLMQQATPLGRLAE